jgi:hypothetical protein
MKFYETHYEDYDRSVQLSNFHEPFTHHFQNYIFYGPSGVGKYSQMIHLVKNYSPSCLKFENKIFSNVEKHNYFINISDIHYEIDMSLLGCNSKIIWHDIFLSIIDIISLKPHKKGFIICKNFHEIHNELLDIFYSYMNILSLKSTMIQRKFPPTDTNSNSLNQFNFSKPIETDINVKFIILTEQISFIPNNILNKCKIQSFKRPTKDKIVLGIGLQKTGFDKQKVDQIINEESILNLKEIYSVALMDSKEQIPKNNFNIICDKIIEHINLLFNSDKNEKHSVFENYANFRDILYDILVYNLEPLDAMRYILFYYLKKDIIKRNHIEKILKNLNTFMFQYGNNYRSFFHLEYFVFSLIECLQS